MVRLHSTDQNSITFGVFISIKFSMNIEVINLKLERTQIHPYCPRICGQTKSKQPLIRNRFTTTHSHCHTAHQHHPRTTVHGTLGV